MWAWTLLLAVCVSRVIWPFGLQIFSEQNPYFTTRHNRPALVARTEILAHLYIAIWKFRLIMVLKRYPRQLSPHGSLVQSSSSSICSSEESRAEPYQPLLQYIHLEEVYSWKTVVSGLLVIVWIGLGFIPYVFWTALFNVFFLRQSKPINCIKQLQHKVTVIKILVVPLLLSLFIFYKKN